MADTSSTGGQARYRKILGSDFSERLFSWGKIQSELESAENEYLQLAASLSSANKNIEDMECRIADLQAKYHTATQESRELSEKLAEETTAHRCLQENYESDTRNWAEEASVQTSALTGKESEISSLKSALLAKENEISSLKMQLAIVKAGVEKEELKKQDLEAEIAGKKQDLQEVTARYTHLSAEYAALLRDKNAMVEQLNEEIAGLKYAHEKEVATLNADFEERSRLYVPTIHELTRTVDSWKYQRECDLTEIHRLKTTLTAREAEISTLKRELEELHDVKRQMLTQMNRIGFSIVQTESETRSKEEQMKAEYERLQQELSGLQSTKQSLETDLTQERETLSTYSSITEEILDEWKKHAEVTRSFIAEAAGREPVEASYGLLAQISGHHVVFRAIAPASYEELRGVDRLIRDAAKRLAGHVDEINCRKEMFVVVPSECMMYVTKTLYASPVCAVEVITPSQVVAVVRNIARFVVYEKTQ